MATWTLTAGLQNLRDQVNDRWPDRDRESDGSIGDTAHQAETSGHNRDDTPGSRPAWDGDPDNTPEVRAWDMDNDLREPGATAQAIVDHIRRLPGVSSVLRYLIYDRRMYHSRDGFAATAYSGASPHTEHIHFEGAWSQAADNNTTFDYRLWEINMPTLDEYAGAASQGIADYVAGAYHAAKEDADYKQANAAQQKAWRNSRDILRGVIGGPVDTVALLNATTSAINAATAGEVTQIQASLSQVLTAVGRVDEDVMAKLSDPATPNQQVADALVSLLGARKDAVVALMR